MDENKVLEDERKKRIQAEYELYKVKSERNIWMAVIACMIIALSINLASIFFKNGVNVQQNQFINGSYITEEVDGND